MRPPLKSAVGHKPAGAVQKVAKVPLLLKWPLKFAINTTEYTQYVCTINSGTV